MTDATMIVFHLGAPGADMDRLTFSLRKDNQLMDEHRAMARRPRVYRGNVFNRLMEIEIEGVPSSSTEEFLDKLCQKQSVGRLLLSDGTFLGPLEEFLTGNRFYAAAREQVEQLVNLFPDNRCEFALEVRNPLTFIPEVSQRLKADDIDARLAGIDVTRILWSEVIQDIRAAAPESPITVWKHEDNPVVWPEVLRSVSGIGEDVAMQGDLDQASLTMSEHVVTRMTDFLERHPETSLKQRRHVISSFRDADRSELPALGNFEALARKATEITKGYEDDLLTIGSISGVTVID
jgi:hypothetical protein